MYVCTRTRMRDRYIAIRDIVMRTENAFGKAYFARQNDARGIKIARVNSINARL